MSSFSQNPKFYNHNIVTVNDFAAMNEVVDYFEINTIILNSCNKDKPTNDVSPVKLVPHGNDYMLSMVKSIFNIKSYEL